MRATIDQAGRLVIPKPLREELGLAPGPVDVTVSGSTLCVEAPVGELIERDGHLFLPAGGPVMTPDDIRDLRLADQR
jgi:AbrB family looped-hinge helix DNA binding protein